MLSCTLSFVGAAYACPPVEESLAQRGERDPGLLHRVAVVDDLQETFGERVLPYRMARARAASGVHGFTVRSRTSEHPVLRQNLIAGPVLRQNPVRRFASSADRLSFAKTPPDAMCEFGRPRRLVVGQTSDTKTPDLQIDGSS